MVDVVKTRGFRSRLPVLPGTASSLTACLSADPASHTTALPVACGRMGLARALRTSLSPVLPARPPGPEGSAPWKCCCPSPTDPPWLCAWGEASPSPEPQALRDGGTREPGKSCFGGGKVEALKALLEPGSAHPESGPCSPSLPCPPHPPQLLP